MEVKAYIPRLWIRKLTEVLLQGEKDSVRKRTSSSLHLLEKQIRTKAEAVEEVERTLRLVAQDLYMICVSLLCGHKQGREKDKWGRRVLTKMKLCLLLRLEVLRGQQMKVKWCL